MGRVSTSISVVVPTRDRPASLARCLAALIEQDAGELDVVVVDDRSRDRAAAATALERLPGARLVHGAGRGPAAARNLGVRAAQGEVVCLLDDDCEPDPGWARVMAAAVSKGAGRIVAAGFTTTPPGASITVLASQTIVNHLLSASRNASSNRLGFAPTCNIAASRELFARLRFDESYPFAAGEDREWCARALAAGVGIEYVPEAVVVHRQSLGLRAFMHQQYRYGRGGSRFRAAATGRRLYGPPFYAGLVREGFRGGLACGAAVLAAQGITATGVAVERSSRRTSRSPRKRRRPKGRSA
jgi:GT2 family glycosyltransferase